MYLSLHQSGQERRRGVVLVTVLLVVAILTLAAYRFSDAMLSESRAVNSYDQANQARLLADAGINYTAALLATQSSASALNNNYTNNPDYFQDILVRDSDTPARRGRFSIISPLPPIDPTTTTQVGDSSTPFLYGVTDEASKININALFQLDKSGTLLTNALTNLAQIYPALTSDIIAAIVDWVDPTDPSPRSGGAKSDYYTTLTPPYNCKNGPLDSIEELLYVKGMTTALLFGNDDNRNGILSQAQMDQGASAIDRGLSAYLTVYSREQNISMSGQPRIFVNDNNLQTLLTNLQAVLDPDLANYIVAYRLYGSAQATNQNNSTNGTNTGTATTTLSTGTNTTPAKPSTGTTSTTARGTTTMAVTITANGQNVATTVTPANPNAPAPIPWSSGKAAIQTAMNNLQSGQGGGKTIASLYDLINSQVTIPASGQGGQPTVISSPFADNDSIRQYLPPVLDQLTTTNQSQIPARINVNTAGSGVLSSIPTANTSGGNTQALTPTQVSAITQAMSQLNSSSNGQAPDPIYQTPTWLLTETGGAFTPQNLSTLSKYITASSQVYRVQSVGHFDGPGPSVRIEAVIDTNAGRPRIVYYRDLTSLGKGYDLPVPQQ
jgi:hypothetical protein